MGCVSVPLGALDVEEPDTEADDDAVIDADMDMLSVMDIEAVEFEANVVVGTTGTSPEVEVDAQLPLPVAEVDGGGDRPIANDVL